MATANKWRFHGGDLFGSSGDMPSSNSDNDKSVESDLSKLNLEREALKTARILSIAQEEDINQLKLQLAKSEAKYAEISRRLADVEIEFKILKSQLSNSTFEELKLSGEVLNGLHLEMKFQAPTKMQAIILPMILAAPYKDLIAEACKGSGGTTCFVLGTLSRVDPKLGKTQALCLCPTRELAIENLKVLQRIGKYTGITSESVIPMASVDGKPKFQASLHKY